MALQLPWKRICFYVDVAFDFKLHRQVYDDQVDDDQVDDHQVDHQVVDYRVDHQRDKGIYSQS